MRKYLENEKVKHNGTHSKLNVLINALLTLILTLMLIFTVSCQESQEAETPQVGQDLQETQEVQEIEEQQIVDSQETQELQEDGDQQEMQGTPGITWGNPTTENKNYSVHSGTGTGIGIFLNPGDRVTFEYSASDYVTCVIQDQHQNPVFQCYKETEYGSTRCTGAFIAAETGSYFISILNTVPNTDTLVSLEYTINRNLAIEQTDGPKILKIINPKSGDILHVGDVVIIEWEDENITEDTDIEILLWSSSPKSHLIAETKNTGNYVWIVTNEVMGENLRMQLSINDAYGTYDCTFSIYP